VPACICVVCRLARLFSRKLELFARLQAEQASQAGPMLSPGLVGIVEDIDLAMVPPVDQCRESHKTQGASVGPATFQLHQLGQFAESPVDDAALEVL
jgi:hypothetical protein